MYFKTSLLRLVGMWTLSRSIWALGIVQPTTFWCLFLIFMWSFASCLCRLVLSQTREGLPADLWSELCLCSIFLSSTSPPIIDSLTSPTWSMCPPLSWTTGPVWVPFPAPWPGSGLWAVHQGNFRVHLICFPFFRIIVLRSLLSNVWIQPFYIIVQFYCCFCWRASPVS